MTLPKLPRKNKRTEAKIDSKVAQWFQDNYAGNVLLEVKIKGGTLKVHQKRLLDMVAKTKEFMYKFPDGSRRTPLDYIVCNDLDAALCTMDGNEGLCVINGKYELKINV